jgi:hypothetical protein
MPSGGYRPGGGRPKGSKNKSTAYPNPVRDADTVLSTPRLDAAVYESALDYAMGVINDPEAPLDAKVRLAIAAMPFQHAKLVDAPQDKRSKAADAAEAVGVGRFATPPAPKMVIN